MTSHAETDVDVPVDAAPTTRRIKTILLWASLCAAAVLPVMRAFDSAMYTSDELMLLVYPMKVMDGASPHVDFYTVYSTPMYHWLAWLYELTSPTPWVTRTVAVGYHVALVLGIYVLNRRFGVFAAWCAATVAGFVVAPLVLYAYAWLAATAFVVWGVALMGHRTSRWQWVVGGALVGLSTGFRYEFFLVGALATLPWILRHPRARYVFGGGLLGALPTFVTLAGDFSSVWSNVVEGRVAGNFRGGSQYVTLDVTIRFALCVLIVVAFMGLALKARDRWFASIGLMGLAMLPQGYQRLDVFHVAYVSDVLLPCAVGAAIGFLAPRLLRGQVGRWVKIGVPTLVAVCLTALVASSAVALADPSPMVRNGDRALRQPPEVAGDVARLIADVRETVPPGANVFLGGSDMSHTTGNYSTFFYLLGNEYRFDQYYLEMAPGVVERAGSGVVQDIDAADALILFDFSKAQAELDYPHLPQGSGDANDAIRASFCISSRQGPFVLWVRCAGGS